jgi:hypothetical protein
VAVSFSLWRAVFLADRTGRPEARRSAARDFVEKMLTDNAITFMQDMKSNEWTFNYYIDNALFRMEQLSKRWPDAINADDLRPPEGERTPDARWNRLQKAFEVAVECLEREVHRPRKERSKGASKK